MLRHHQLLQQPSEVEGFFLTVYRSLCESDLTVIEIATLQVDDDSRYLTSSC